VTGLGMEVQDGCGSPRWTGFKVWKKGVFGGRKALLFESYLGRQSKDCSPSRYLIDFITSLSDVPSDGLSRRRSSSFS
jgi:hypothetical protein